MSMAACRQNRRMLTAHPKGQRRCVQLLAVIEQRAHFTLTLAPTAGRADEAQEAVSRRTPHANRSPSPLKQLRRAVGLERPVLGWEVSERVGRRLCESWTEAASRQIAQSRLRKSHTPLDSASLTRQSLGGTT